MLDSLLMVLFLTLDAMIAILTDSGLWYQILRPFCYEYFKYEK